MMVMELLGPYRDALAEAPLRSFRDWPEHRGDVPATAWGVYTIWPHGSG